MILAPNGLHLVKRAIVPMSARQVTWFIDPEALLRHLADLGSVKVAAYCKHCYDAGLPEGVTATFSPDRREWTIHCSCAEYPPVKDNGAGPMTIRKVEDDGSVTIVKVHSVDELLFRLGWSFKCAADCAKLGMEDGVQGENDPDGQVLKVTCGCTERIYAQSAQAS